MTKTLFENDPLERQKKIFRSRINKTPDVLFKRCVLVSRLRTALSIMFN